MKWSCIRQFNTSVQHFFHLLFISIMNSTELSLVYNWSEIVLDKKNLDESPSYTPPPFFFFSFTLYRKQVRHTESTSLDNLAFPSSWNRVTWKRRLDAWFPPSPNVLLGKFKEISELQDMCLPKEVWLHNSDCLQLPLVSHFRNQFHYSNCKRKLMIATGWVSKHQRGKWQPGLSVILICGVFFI